MKRLLLVGSLLWLTACATGGYRPPAPPVDHTPAWAETCRVVVQERRRREITEAERLACVEVARAGGQVEDLRAWCDALPPEPEPVPVRVNRTGPVRISGRVFADDGGPFLSLSTSLFWGPWAMRHDRTKLEKNLAFISSSGFHAIRVLGEVGGEYWVGREINPHEAGYVDVMRGLLDLAYDTYGLRVQIAIFGGVDFSVSQDLRRRTVDLIAEIVSGREQKVSFIEIANEGWQTGFPHPEGTAELRDLTRRLKSRTSIPVAITSPAGPESYGQPSEDYDFGPRVTYEGVGADLGTMHFDRDTHMADGAWRPVRQPWGYPPQGMPTAGVNDEPVGPGSSVNTENDPLRLTMSAVVTWIAGMAQYTLHTRGGIFGGIHEGPHDVTDVARIDEIVGGLAAMQRLLPPDLPNWSKQNGQGPPDWPDHPFAGSIKDGQFWPDGGTDHGCVRDYGAVSGDRFVTAPIGIRRYYDVRARRALEFDQVDPVTGDVLQHVVLATGQVHRLEGKEAFVLIGSYR